jgi:hypothetical protein
LFLPQYLPQHQLFGQKKQAEIPALGLKVW